MSIKTHFYLLIVQFVKLKPEQSILTLIQCSLITHRPLIPKLKHFVSWSVKFVGRNPSFTVTKPTFYSHLTSLGMNPSDQAPMEQGNVLPVQFFSLKRLTPVR